MAALLELEYFGNTVHSYVIACGIAIGVIAATYLFRRVVARRIQSLAKKTDTRLDDLIIACLNQVKLVYTSIVALYLGSLYLSLPVDVETISEKVATVAVLIQLGVWLATAITFLVTTYRSDREKSGHSPGAGAASLIGVVARAAVWAGVLLLILGNLGVDVSAFVAGLGIGGIAIALAVQNILSDVFASFSITFDQPFELGDFIIVGDFMGTVEKVGLKTTRIRSLSGEMLVFSNADLLNARIRNYKRMDERRCTFSIGVTYQTPADQVEAIPAKLEEIVSSKEHARFDRAHFKQFGDSAMIFDVVYYMVDPDYALFMDTQQAINLEILRHFNEQNIEFAYPTQTVWLEKSAA